MKKILYVVLIGMSALFLTACSYNERKLIGRWESSDSSHFIELRNDGTATYEWVVGWAIEGGTNATDYEDGVYLVDSDTLNFYSEESEDAEILKWYYSFDDDELILTDYDDGDEEIFEKVY